MTDAQYQEECDQIFATTRDHVDEYTRNHGVLRPEAAWILSPFDTWEANPFFSGPRPPHPESCEEELDAWYDAHGAPAAPARSDEELWGDVVDELETKRSF